MGSCSRDVKVSSERAKDDTENEQTRISEKNLFVNIVASRECGAPLYFSKTVGRAAMSDD